MIEKKPIQLTFEPFRKKRRSSKQPMEHDILEAHKVCRSARHIADHLKISFQTLKRYCKMYNIWDKIKADTRLGISGRLSPFLGKMPVDEIAANKYKKVSPTVVIDKYIRAGYKEGKCDICGYKEARITDGKIPLLLDFIDDNKENYSVDNIQFICYNCYHNTRGNLTGSRKVGKQKYFWG